MYHNFEVECPYCEEGFDLDHDDGTYYDEGRGVETECPECGKNFLVYSSQSWSFTGEKADCLNGSEHKWSEWTTMWRGEKDLHFGEYYERRRCESCDKKQMDWHKQRLDSRPSERFDGIKPTPVRKFVYKPAVTVRREALNNNPTQS